MRDFFYSFRATCLFVGTVIGAGFATGEEIKLFFKGSGDGTVILSALIFATMSFCFMTLSKIRKLKLPKAVKTLARLVRFLAVCLSFVAMCSAGEKIVYDLFRLRFGGIIIATICLFFAGRESKILGNVNAFIVPVIAVFVMVVYLVADTTSLNFEKISFAPAFLYSSMNIFSGGIMLERIARDMSVKQSALSAVMNFFIVGALMLCIKKSIESEFSSMPLISVAQSSGVGLIAQIVVLLAVFTTMLSDASIIFPEIKKALRKENLAIAVFMAFSAVSSVASFSSVVEKGYPLIGYSGVVYFTYAVVCLLSRGFLFNKSNHGVHSACKGAKYNRTAHYEVELEYLTAVND